MKKLAISLGVLALIELNQAHRFDDEISGYDLDEPIHKSSCNHICAAACSVFRSKDEQEFNRQSPLRCGLRCGCNDDEGDYDLRKALKSYKKLKARELEAVTAEQIYSFARGSEKEPQSWRYLERVYDKYVHSYNQFERDAAIAGLEDECDMDCVVDCDSYDFRGFQYCFGTCGCVDEWSYKNYRDRSRHTKYQGLDYSEYFESSRSYKYRQENYRDWADWSYQGSSSSKRNDADKEENHEKRWKQHFEQDSAKTCPCEKEENEEKHTTKKDETSTYPENWYDYVAPVPPIQQPKEEDQHEKSCKCSQQQPSQPVPVPDVVVKNCTCPQVQHTQDQATTPSLPEVPTEPLPIVKPLPTVDPLSPVEPITPVEPTCVNQFVGKAVSDLSADQYLLYVEEQKDFDRISATAVFNYLLSSSPQSPLTGSWNKATFTVLQETFSKSSVSFELEITRIHETTYQTLEEQQTTICQTTIVPTTAVTTTKETMTETHNITSAGGSKGIETVITKTIIIDEVASETSVTKCLPSSSIISTTVIDSQSTTQIYERIIDASQLTSLTKRVSVTANYLAVFDNVLMIEFSLQGSVLNKFFVLTHQTCNDTFVVVLDQSHKIVGLYSSIITLDSITGQKYIHLISTVETSEITTLVNTFIQTHQVYIKQTRTSIAVAQAAATQIYGIGYEILSWQVSIQSETTLSTLALVEGFDASGVLVISYKIDISTFENIKGVYQVIVTSQDGTQRRVDVIIHISSSYAHSYEVVVAENAKILEFYQIGVEALSATLHKTTVSIILSISSSTQSIVNQYTQIHEIIIVSEESAAAVHALLKWVYNVDNSQVTLRKVTDAVKGASIQVFYQNTTYHVDVVQISYGGYDVMYQITLINSLGVSTVYNVVVHRVGDQVYDASVIIDTKVVVTYEVHLNQFSGDRHVFTSCKVVEVKASRQIITIITTYIQYLSELGKTTTTIISVEEKEMVSPSDNTTIIIETGKVVENKTTIEVDPAIVEVKNVTEVIVNKTVEVVTTGEIIIAPPTEKVNKTTVKEETIEIKTKNLTENITEVSITTHSKNQTDSVVTETVVDIVIKNVSTALNETIVIVPEIHNETVTTTTTTTTTTIDIKIDPVVINETVITNQTVDIIVSEPTVVNQTAVIEKIVNDVEVIITEQLNQTIVNETVPPVIETLVITNESVTVNETVLVNQTITLNETVVQVNETSVIVDIPIIEVQNATNTTTTTTTITNTTVVIEEIFVPSVVNETIFHNKTVTNTTVEVIVPSISNEILVKNVTIKNTTVEVIIPSINTTSVENNTVITTEEKVLVPFLINETIFENITTTTINETSVVIPLRNETVVETNTTITVGEVIAIPETKNTTFTNTTVVIEEFTVVPSIQNITNTTTTTTVTTKVTEEKVVVPSVTNVTTTTMSELVIPATLNETKVTTTTVITEGSNITGGLVIKNDSVTTVVTEQIVNRTTITTTETGETTITKNSTELISTGPQIDIKTTIETVVTKEGGIDFQIAVNPITKEEYRVYTNGTVTTLTGVIITTEGMQGLIRYITTTITETKTIEPEFSIAKNPKTGEEYRIWKNGTVTTTSNVFVTIGGVQGLMQYLTTTTTTTVTKQAEYQVAINPVTKEEYKIYTNGTVFDSKWIIVTTEGIAGLTKILSQTVETTVTKTVDYQIAKNPITGEEYRIYSNGTVFDSLGVIITTEGVQGLMKILQSQQTTTTTTTIQSSSQSFDYQYIILSDGSKYRLYLDGRVEDMNGVMVVSSGGIAAFSQWLLTQTVVRTIVRTVVPDYQIAVANGVEYYIHSDGNVTLKNGTFIVSGGIQGLKQYLTVTRTVTKTVQADYQIVNANGVEYHMYTNGSIFLSTGEFVTVGGVEGLRAYLLELQRASQPDYQIVTANGVDYRFYSNGSIYDDLGAFITDGGIEGLKAYLTKTTVVTETVVPDYQVVTANGVDYHLYTNNSVYTISGDLITTEGVEGLKSYLMAQAQAQATTTTTTTTTTVTSGIQTTNGTQTGATQLFLNGLPEEAKKSTNTTSYIVSLIILLGIIIIVSKIGYDAYCKSQNEKEISMQFEEIIENDPRERFLSPDLYPRV